MDARLVQATEGRHLTRIVPGQMWMWDFKVAEGWWPLEAVTEERRVGYNARNIIIHRGLTFTVISLDDPGPFEVVGIDEDGMVSNKPTRWHVVLVKDTLAWMRHDDFGVSKLIKDVE